MGRAALAAVITWGHPSFSIFNLEQPCLFHSSLNSAVTIYLCSFSLWKYVRWCPNGLCEGRPPLSRLFNGR